MHRIKLNSMSIDFKKNLYFFYRLSLFIPNSLGLKQATYSKIKFCQYKGGNVQVGGFIPFTDDHDFIWIGTNGSGLYRYDGNRL